MKGRGLLWAPVMALAVGTLLAGEAAAENSAHAWTRAQRVSDSGNFPHVAFDADGDAVAVWLDGGVVRASFRRAGGTWSASRAVSAAGATAESLTLSVGEAGDAVAAWLSFTSPGPRSLVVARRSPGGKFAAPRVLARGDETFNLGRPRVAVDGVGRSVVVWSRSSGIWAAHGNRTAAPARAAQIATGSATLPFAAWDRRGRAVVAWADTRSMSISISTSSAAAFEPPRVVDVGEAVLSLDLAVSPGGRLALSFQSYSGAPLYRTSVRTLVGRVGGAIGGPWFVGDGVGYLAGSLAAIDDDGRATIVWSQDYSSRFPLFMSRATRVGVSSPQALSDDVGGFDLALDHRGRAHAVWSRWAGDYVVEAAEAPPAARFGEPVELSARGYNAFGPQIDVDRDGDVIAAWGRSFGSRTFIQAAGFDAAGPQLRALRVPGRVSTGARAHFAVTPVDVWSATAGVRWSFGDGETARGARTAHLYRRPGRFRVRVTVTDARGNARTAVRTVRVTRP